MPKGPVCILGAGYSSGWVSSCFHFPSELLAVELLCKAKGASHNYNDTLNDTLNTYCCYVR